MAIQTELCRVLIACHEVSRNHFDFELVYFSPTRSFPNLKPDPIPPLPLPHRSARALQR